MMARLEMPGVFVRAYPLIAVGAEQAGVVAFLHHNVGDARLVLFLQADAGLPDSQQFIIQHLKQSIHTQSFVRQENCSPY